MYAFQKTFLDGTEGIRVEDIECIQGDSLSPFFLEFAYFIALPCPLQKLLDVGEFVATERATCKACDKPAGQFCARCGGVKYCSKVTSLLSTRKIIY